MTPKPKTMKATKAELFYGIQWLSYDKKNWRTLEVEYCTLNAISSLKAWREKMPKFRFRVVPVLVTERKEKRK
jgi:hypothetical protein